MNTTDAIERNTQENATKKKLVRNVKKRTVSTDVVDN